MCWVCCVLGCLGGAGLRLLRGAWVDSVCGFWADLGVLWVCWGCFGSIGKVLCAAFGLAWGCFGLTWGCFGLAWGCFGLAWCWFWCGCSLCRDSVPTFLRVLGWLGGALVLAWCWLGLCGGNYYHRRCVAACRRRVGGLWSQNPPWLLGRARAAGPLGGCVGRVRHVFVCLSWWCGLSLLVAWGELLP